MRWLVAVPTLLGLGLVMGFSPTLYGYALHALVRRRPQAVYWMLAGLTAASTMLVLIFQVFDPTNITRVLTHGIDGWLLRRGVDITAGVLLAASGTALLLLNHEDRVRPQHRRSRHGVAPGAASAPAAVLVGFGNTVIGSSGIATMYVVGRMASDVSPHLALRAVAYCAFLVSLVGPYLLAALAWERYPQAADKVMVGYDWLVRRNPRRVVGVALIAAGAVFFGLGLRA